MCLPAKTTKYCNYNMTTSPQQQLPRKAKKSVRFNQVVHVAPFERVTMEQANDIWYSNIEIAIMKSSGREMAASYRKLGDHQIEGDCYRGFEGYTFIRQRQRLLSNRCAVYAYKQGLNADTIAAFYTQCNQWSSQVAFVQAIHDFVDTYSDTTSAISYVKLMMMNSVPSVDSMVPPPDLPFAVQGFIVLQSQRKSKLERKLKRRSHTAGIRRVRQRVC